MEEKLNLIPFVKFQKELSKKVELKKVKDFRKILAIDVAYKDSLALCIGILYDLEKEGIEKVYYKIGKVKFPYIPTFLFLREAPIILRLIEKVKERYDLILVDGHGLAHPRKAGLATVVGVISKKPTIGIGKSFLYGKFKGGIIFVGKKKVGIKFGKYYASIGSNIDFDSLKKFLERINFKYPKAMRIADRLSKEIFKKLKVKNI